MLVNARRIERTEGIAPSILLAFEDITDRERLAFEAEETPNSTASSSTACAKRWSFSNMTCA
jgi:hypothetical protein